MSYCIKCGHELLPSAKYCLKCGSEALTVRKPEKPLEPAPYQSPIAEMYYEILRPAAEEKSEKTSVKHRESIARPFAWKEKD